MNLDLGVIAAWSSAFLAGAWVAIGVASAVTGRMIVNPRRADWSFVEVEMLAANTVVQGLALAAYSLLGALFMSGVFNSIWFDRGWLIFIGAPFFLVLMATMLFQTYVEHRHSERLRRSAGQEPAR
jgi:hypothetical protein